MTDKPSRLPVKTGKSRPVTGGRPPVILDSDDVRREASVRLRSDSGVAHALGTTLETLRECCKRQPDVAEAFAEGRAASVEKLRTSLDKRIDDPKCHPMLLLAAANQSHDLGGLGWVNPKSHTEITGRIEHVLTPAQEAFTKMVEGKRNTIEAEYKVIE